MDTFEFKIKCFCLIIFLLAFTLISKAQVDPHSPTPEEQVITYESRYVVVSCEDDNFNSSIYIEEDKYFFYKATFPQKNTEAIASFLIKNLGKPSYQNETNLIWETINGKVVRSFFISLKNGKLKIKSYNLEGNMLVKLNQLSKSINKIIDAKEIIKTPKSSIAKM